MSVVYCKQRLECRETSFGQSPRENSAGGRSNSASTKACSKESILGSTEFETHLECPRRLGQVVPLVWDRSSHASGTIGLSLKIFVCQNDIFYSNIEQTRRKAYHPKRLGHLVPNVWDDIQYKFEHLVLKIRALML